MTKDEVRLLELQVKLAELGLLSHQLKLQDIEAEIAILKMKIDYKNPRLL